MVGREESLEVWYEEVRERFVKLKRQGLVVICLTDAAGMFSEVPLRFVLAGENNGVIVLY